VIEGAKADQRSDLFALGVSMFECVTGRRPFSGPVPYQIFKRIVTGPLPDPNEFRKDLDPRLVEIIQKLLCREVPDRYQCGEELEQDLDEWLISEPGKRLVELEKDAERESMVEADLDDAPTPSPAS
jgi:serine/threonine-protein kinase